MHMRKLRALPLFLLIFTLFLGLNVHRAGAVACTIVTTCTVTPSTADAGSSFSYDVKITGSGDCTYTPNSGTGRRFSFDANNDGTFELGPTAWTAGVSSQDRFSVWNVVRATPGSFAAKGKGEARTDLYGTVSNIGNCPSVTVQAPLTVTKAGTGSGTVTSAPAGISCGADCSQSYNNNTSVTLTESPTAGSTFTGWSGACSGAATTCVLTMNAAKAVTATFASTPSGTCSVSPTTAGTGQSVTWTAVPSGGNGTYTYVWSGTDSLSGTAISVSKSYATTGTKTGSVTITSNGQSSGAIACSNSVVVSTPAPTCSPSVQSAYLNVNVTISAGSGNGTFSWTGGGTPATGSGSSFTTKYSTTGVKTVTVTSGGQSVGCDINVTVPPAPVCAPSLQSVQVGQSAGFTASSGSGAYSWSAPSGTPTSGTGSAFSTIFNAVGTYSVTTSNQ